MMGCVIIYGGSRLANDSGGKRMNLGCLTRNDFCDSSEKQGGRVEA